MISYEKTWKKLLCVILALTLLAGILPIQATALDSIRLSEDEIAEETASVDAAYIQIWLASLPTNDKIGKPIG